SGQFTFGRKPTVPRDREITITFRIEGTAEEGVDYEPLNTKVTIPPFGPRVTVPIIPIPDNLEEGLESILLIYESDNCGCIIADTATLFLLDPDISVQTSFEELEACAGQDFTFEPVIDFGREPFSFLWSDGSTEETLTVNIDEPSTFAVTIMDACGNSATATTTINLKEPPSLTIDGTYTWCEGRAPELAPILLQGQAPWNIIYSVNDSLQPEITGITESPYLLPLDQAGTYEITSFSDAACEGTIMGVIEVLPIPLALDFEATLPSCPNAPDGSIRLFPEGGVKPYAFEWDTLGITSEELLNLQPGSYAVTVTDAEGCIVMESITLPSPANAVCDLDLDANLFVPNAFSPNNDGFNDEFTIYPNPQSIIQELSYQIYDRWGGLRFETPTFPLGNTVLWRPDTNVPIGVYVCIVKITLVDGTSQLLGQDVLLIR
ncbi:MAG: gliding motility-associated C-terminal domain-containing protein, partial [Bacteroidota bacterium]